MDKSAETRDRQREAARRARSLEGRIWYGTTVRRTKFSIPGEIDMTADFQSTPAGRTRYLAQVQVRQAVPKSGLVSGAHGAEGHQRQVFEDHERARPDVAHPILVQF